MAQIWDRCIGCRYCTTACPYTRRYFNWQAPRLSPPATPSIPTWPRARKDRRNAFCHQRSGCARRRAEGVPPDGDVRKLLPARRPVRPTIVYGDQRPESEVSKLAKSGAFRLLEELGTHPKVVYLRESKWKE